MTIHLDRAPQFIAPTQGQVAGTGFDKGAVVFKGLERAGKADKLCVFQPSSHKHVMTDVPKADFTRLMKLDPATVRFASSHEKEFQAARSILQHAGVPGVEGMSTRLTLSLAKQVGSGQMTPEAAALVARTPNAAQREHLMALAGASPHVVQLMAAADKGSVTASQLQGLQDLVGIHPAAADRLAEKVLAHLADPSQPMPDMDAGIVRGGIDASAEAGTRQGASGLQDAGAARKTALSLNLAKLVTNPDGSLNAGRLDAAITQLGQPPTPQTEHTRVAVKMLTRLRDDGDFAAQLQSIGAPRTADNPAHGILRATLGLKPDQTVTAAHARQAALSALVSDLRQSSVGSCFGTATAVMVHDSMPETFLAEIKSLIEDGHFDKTVDGHDEQVAISQRVSTKELQQTIMLNAQGLLATAGGKPVDPPTALHETPGMRAGLAALGVAPDAMASTVSGALKAMGKNAVLTPQAILQQIAMRQEGLSAEHLAGVERVRTLEGQVRELSIAVQRGGPDAAEAQRQMAGVQRDLQKALSGIGFSFKTEAMDRLAQAMGRATDAFQGQMDNRLLRAWEYTVSSVLEKGEGDRVKADALKGLNGRIGSSGADTAEMGMDTFARHTLFSSNTVTIERGKRGHLDKTGEVFTVRPDLGMPAIDRSLVTEDDRAKFNPNPATRAPSEDNPTPKNWPPSDEVVFLHKFQTQMQSRFEEVMTERLAVQYDAAAMGSGEIAADGSSDRGGFVLHDTAGQADPLTWRPIDTPQAYKALAASVMRDVGREVAASVARGQPAAVQQWLTQFSDKVGAHAETEAFTAVMVDRARFNSPLPSDSNPKPWEPASGGKTHVTGKYLGSGAPKEVSLYGSSGEKGVTPVHAQGVDFVTKVLDTFKGMKDALPLAEQGRDVGVPVRTTGHAFLARPGHPSLAGALASPDTAAWVTDKLVTPGQVQASTPLSAAEQRPVVEAVLTALKVPDTHPSRATILGALASGKTPAQLHTWVKDQLETHNPEAFGDKLKTPETRAAAIEVAMVKSLKPAVPGIVMADTNWEVRGGRVELGMVFNPISGGVEPWFSHEDGSLLGANAKPEASTWASWNLMTNPAEFGYT